MNLDEKVQKLLVAVINQSGKTLRELSVNSGIEYSRMWHIYHGKRKITMQETDTLARLTNTTIQQLIHEATYS